MCIEIRSRMKQAHRDVDVEKLTTHYAYKAAKERQRAHDRHSPRVT